MDSDNQIKIADFGFASLMRDDDLLETSCGSPHYAAPEVVQGLKYDGTASDVWSCGVILYALLTGKLPFDDDNIARLLGKVKTGKFSMPSHLPADVQDLIARMITVDPEKRITIAEIKRHPWYRSNRTGMEDEDDNPLGALGDVAFDPREEKDHEIMETLNILGWGTEQEVLAALHSPEYNLEKVFYRLLERRQQEKEALLASLYPDDASSDSRGEGTDSPDGSPHEGSRYLSRRKSFNSGGGDPVPSPSRTSSMPVAAPRSATRARPGSISTAMPPSSPGVAGGMPESPNPKKSWFSNMFDKKSKAEKAAAAAGSSSTFGLHSTVGFETINAELKRSLDSLNIKWKLQGQYTLKAKYITQQGAVVKFKIEIKDLTSQGHLINFSLRQGDLATYRSLCDYIQQEIKV